MSDDRRYRATLRIHGEERAFEITRPAGWCRAPAEELGSVRRAAQAEANRAYADWTRDPSATHTYAVYRAAQDRADAAQDQLAEWARRSAQVSGSRP